MLDKSFQYIVQSWKTIDVTQPISEHVCDVCVVLSSAHKSVSGHFHKTLGTIFLRRCLGYAVVKAPHFRGKKW